MVRNTVVALVVALLAGCPSTRRTPESTRRTEPAKPTEPRLDPYAWNLRVRQFVAQERPILQRCWDAELRRVEDLAASGAYRGGETVPNLAGELVLAVSFDGNGKVDGARTDQNTLQNPAVERCMLERVATWTVPPPPDADGMEIEIPFEFSVMGPG